MTKNTKIIIWTIIFIILIVCSIWAYRKYGKPKLEKTIDEMNREELIAYGIAHGLDMSVLTPLTDLETLRGAIKVAIDIKKQFENFTS